MPDFLPLSECLEREREREREREAEREREWWERERDLEDLLLLRLGDLLGLRLLLLWEGGGAVREEICERGRNAAKAMEKAGRTPK